MSCDSEIKAVTAGIIARSIERTNEKNKARDTGTVDPEEPLWAKYLTPEALAKAEEAECEAQEIPTVGAALEPQIAKKPCQWSMPESSEAMRVVPNAILRSALFGIVHRGQRRYINGEALFAWKGTKVRFKGQQLDQYDLDVWLQVIHLIRQQPSDQSICHFTVRSFIKAIGRKISGNAAKVLFGSLERMVACALTVELDGASYTGSLIEKFALDKQSGLYAVRLNADLCHLFGSSHTRLRWETRLALSAGLSRWLHGYVLSHQATSRAPHRITIQTLCSLTGSSAAALKKFREMLKRSMTALEQANVVQKWSITEGDALEFVR